jgi:hypothetical protein
MTFEGLLGTKRNSFEIRAGGPHSECSHWPRVRNYFGLGTRSRRHTACMSRRDPDPDPDRDRDRDRDPDPDRDPNPDPDPDR